MATIGLYMAGMTQDEANKVRQQLNTIAAGLGYTAKAGPTTGAGNAAAMLVDIAQGKLEVTMLQNFVYPGQYRMDADEAQGRLDKIRSTITAALPNDTQKSIMQRLHAEKRYGDVEQAWIDEAVANYPDARTSTGHTVRELVAVFERERAQYVERFGEADGML